MDIRPKLHFTPPAGWSNDPNGLVFDGEKYHLFYQHNPNDIRWGDMHWGHAVSDDLFNWEHRDIALYPDEHGTMFSGSCVCDINNAAGFGKNALLFLYTSHGDMQRQCGAVSTDGGITFEKFENNPLIDNPGYKDFRDPKAFFDEGTGCFHMVLAAGDRVIFYKSKDFLAWEETGQFKHVFEKCNGVWECPDIFKLSAPGGGEKWALLLSMGMPREQGGSRMTYFIGEWDGKTFIPDSLPNTPVWMDDGMDCYAGTTFDNFPRQKRVFISWMSNAYYADKWPTAEHMGMMSLPRELSLGIDAAGGYYIKQTPILPDEHSAKIIKASGDEFLFKLYNDGGNQLLFGKRGGNIFIDRSRVRKDISHPDMRKTVQCICDDDEIIAIWDNCALEIFTGDGKHVISMRAYPDAVLDKTGFEGEAKYVQF